MFLFTGNSEKSAGGNHIGQGGRGASSSYFYDTYGDILAPDTFGEAGCCRLQNSDTIDTVCIDGGAPVSGGALHIVAGSIENAGTISARYGY